MYILCSLTHLIVLTNLNHITHPKASINNPYKNESELMKLIILNNQGEREKQLRQKFSFK